MEFLGEAGSAQVQNGHLWGRALRSANGYRKRDRRKSQSGCDATLALLQVAVSIFPFETGNLKIRFGSADLVGKLEGGHADSGAVVHAGKVEREALALVGERVPAVGFIAAENFRAILFNAVQRGSVLLCQLGRQLVRVVLGDRDIRR